MVANGIVPDEASVLKVKREMDGFLDSDDLKGAKLPEGITAAAIARVYNAEHMVQCQEVLRAAKDAALGIKAASSGKTPSAAESI